MKQDLSAQVRMLGETISVESLRDLMRYGMTTTAPIYPRIAVSGRSIRLANPSWISIFLSGRLPDGTPYFISDAYKEKKGEAVPRVMVEAYDQRTHLAQISFLKVLRGKPVWVLGPVYDYHDGTMVSSIGIEVDPVGWRRQLWLDVAIPWAASAMLAVLWLVPFVGRRPERIGGIECWPDLLKVALTGILITLLCVWVAYNSEARTRRAMFIQLAEKRTLISVQAVRLLQDIEMKGMASLLAIHPDLLPEQFQRYADHLTRNRHALVWAWAPAVYATERADFERQVRERFGWPTFHIWDVDGAGNQRAAGERSVYFPVLLGARDEAIRPIIGRDISTDPVRRSAYEFAIQHKLTVSTEPVDLLVESQGKKGVVVYRAVFDPVSDKLLGLVMAAITLDTFLQADALEVLSLGGDNLLQLALHPLSRSDSVSPAVELPLMRRSRDLVLVRPVAAFLRHYALVVHPTPSFLVLYKMALPWITFVAGIVITLLVLLRLHAAHRRRFEVEDEQQLREAGRFHQAAAELATANASLRMDEFDDGLNRCLAILGRYLSAQRAYVFANDLAACEWSNTHEWCAEGVEPQIDYLQHVPFSTFPSLIERFKRGEALVLGSLLEMPLAMDSGRALLAAQNIKAVIMQPMMIDGDLIGFLGSDDTVRERNFTETELSLLRLAADSFAATLVRHRHYAALQSVNAELSIALHRANDMADRAESASAAKSQFLANMSHEIRTPMSAIIGFADLLAADISDEHQRQQAVVIAQSGRSLLRLLNDVLDLSKIEAGKLSVESTIFLLAPLIEEVGGLFALGAQQKGIHLHWALEPGVPERIQLDETRLRQILVNLVGNAVKFTEEGEVRLVVRATPACSVGEAGSSGKVRLVDLHFTVTDTGVGLNAAFKHKLFGMFEQDPGQDRMRYGGTGLGLAISLRLARLMNGAIVAEDAPTGRGAVFVLVLHDVPVADEQGTAFSENVKHHMACDTNANVSDLTAELAQVPASEREALASGVQNSLRSQRILHVEELGTKIVALGDQHGLANLKQAGHELLSAVHLFDITMMQTLLKRLGGVLAEM